tara:strand:- start:938 stop:1270 length:333 start_codon:yes stop_codon:yes gene_type:complete
MSRYVSREVAENDKEQYDKIFKKRGVEKIVQYRSPKATYVTDEQIARIDCHQVVWTYGMSYEKLAHQFYGDFRQWWVIAGFNRKPTESHVKMGETIRIPKDISQALEVIE